MIGIDFLVSVGISGLGFDFLGDGFGLALLSLRRTRRMLGLFLTHTATSYPLGFEDRTSRALVLLLYHWRSALILVVLDGVIQAHLFYDILLDRLQVIQGQLVRCHELLRQLLRVRIPIYLELGELPLSKLDGQHYQWVAA